MNDEEELERIVSLAPDPPLAARALRNLVRADEAPAWSIRVAAEQLGVSPHTLRYYERAGLVRVPRDGSGHRRYDAPAVRRLVFLIRMRASGMPVADLRRYVDLVDAGPDTVGQRLELLRDHRDALRRRVTELRLALAVTEYKITTYAEGPQP